jgi:hypothetical protein
MATAPAAEHPAAEKKKASLGAIFCYTMASNPGKSVVNTFIFIFARHMR